MAADAAARRFASETDAGSGGGGKEDATECEEASGNGGSSNGSKGAKRSTAGYSKRRAARGAEDGVPLRPAHEPSSHD